jgi:hypothetical protein
VDIGRPPCWGQCLVVQAGVPEVGAVAVVTLEVVDFRAVADQVIHGKQIEF